jgi:hypothetical protein
MPLAYHRGKSIASALGDICVLTVGRFLYR